MVWASRTGVGFVVKEIFDRESNFFSVCMAGGGGGGGGGAYFSKN